MIGRVQARITKQAIAGAGIFILVFAAALVRHTVFIPGGLFIVFMISSVIPPRALVVADQGVAVVNRSLVHGRPTKLIGLYPHSAVFPSYKDGRRSRVFLGLEWITFSSQEWARLQQAVQFGQQPVSG